MKIIKRNGSEVAFDITKISNAIRAANKEVPEDDRLTERIHQACKVMDIQLVDHIIVCRGRRYYSYADHGRLL